jgi:hypothetical protein
MKVPTGETAAWGDVEVADHLIHSNDTFNPAALLALGIDLLRVAFSLALLDILSFSKRPLFQCIRFANFVTGIATSWFFRILRCRGSSTFTTIVRVQMNSYFMLRMPS